MGLDQYLYAEKYVSGWAHAKPEDRQEMHKLGWAIDGLKEMVCEGSPHAEVRVCIAYWRKANAIHRWFVDNCQEGVDDCNPYLVTREQLAELRGLCMRVIEASKLAEGMVANGKTFKPEWGEWRTNLEEGKIVLNPEVAQELLPAQAGFFFGSTDYDQWYMQNLMDTVEQIDRALRLVPEDDWAWSFSYRSSW